MVPQISPLVQAFLVATRRRMSPCTICECWLPEHSIVPKEPVDEIHAIVTQHLDENTTRKPSNTVWDMFACPDSDKSNWKEDCLSYSPGATIDLSSRMLGIWLALHNEEGRYQGMARVLKFEGHMLVYDPQTNGAGWIPMRGVPSSLTAVELWSTSDLGNFYPCPSLVPVDLKPSQPPPVELAIKYVPAGAESSQSTSTGLDQFAEWDTEEVQDWSWTPSPLWCL